MTVSQNTLRTVRAACWMLLSVLCSWPEAERSTFCQEARLLRLCTEPKTASHSLSPARHAFPPTCCHTLECKFHEGNLCNLGELSLTHGIVSLLASSMVQTHQASV